MSQVDGSDNPWGLRNAHFGHGALLASVWKVRISPSKKAWTESMIYVEINSVGGVGNRWKKTDRQLPKMASADG
jgi:hypothetical protein